MTTALVVALVASPWALWAMYVMVMGVYRAHLDGRLTPVTKVLAAPWVVLGFALDAAVNIIIATVVFLELPREFLVTTRLQRHILHSHGWRGHLATWICDHLLDVFDPTGNHC